MISTFDGHAYRGYSESLTCSDHECSGPIFGTLHEQFTLLECVVCGWFQWSPA